VCDGAGLVPDAHLGKGMGNQFLGDLSAADCLIQVVDASGKTDAEGKETDNYYPGEEIRFLEDEITFWIEGIIKRSWNKSRSLDALATLLSGLRITKEDVVDAAEKCKLSTEGQLNWRDDAILAFSKEIRKISKPIIIAANKMDVAGAEANLEKMKKDFPNHIILPCSAEAELSLRKAAEKGLIKYIPGDPDFEIIGTPNPRQVQALEFLRAKMKKFGSTGVQKIIDEAVSNLLNLIIVYPVEDEKKFANNFGDVLPDAHLLPRGSTAVDLAAKVHTDLAKGFLYGLNTKTNMRIGKEHVLEPNDVIKIISARAK